MNSNKKKNFIRSSEEKTNFIWDDELRDEDMYKKWTPKKKNCTWNQLRREDELYMRWWADEKNLYEIISGEKKNLMAEHVQNVFW